MRDTKLYQEFEAYALNLIPKYRNSRTTQRAKQPWDDLMATGVTQLTDIPVDTFALRMRSLTAYDPNFYEMLVKLTNFLPEDAQDLERYFIVYYGLDAKPKCKHCGKELKAKKRFRLSGTREDGGDVGYGNFCSGRSCAASYQATNDKRKATNLERHCVEAPAQSKEVQAKMKATLEERYGVSATMHCPNIAGKVAKTNEGRYGGATPFAAKETQDKSKVTLQERYGVDNSMGFQEFANKAGNGKRKHGYSKMFDPDRVGNCRPLFSEDEYFGVFNDRLKGIPNRYPWECLECGTDFIGTIVRDSNTGNAKPRCPKCFPKIISVGEQLLVSAVREACGENVEVKQGDRELLEGREVDVLVPELKLAFEYNGIYWHSELAGKKDENYHQSKADALREKGYRLVNVWEDELYKLPTSILHTAQEACGYGKPVDLSQAYVTVKTGLKGTLDEYHREGNLGGTGSVYTLHLGNDEVAKLQVSQTPKKKKDATSKARLRYITMEGFYVEGGFTFLLDEVLSRVSTDKQFEVEIDPTYDDESIYAAAGFKHVKDSATQSWYLIKPYKYSVRLPRKDFTERAKPIDPDLRADSSMSASRLAKLGADRVWGVKRQVWQLEVKK